MGDDIEVFCASWCSESLELIEMSMSSDELNAIEMSRVEIEASDQVLREHVRISVEVDKKHSENRSQFSRLFRNLSHNPSLTMIRERLTSPGAFARKALWTTI
jgi:hypothetical protein